ncbi:MAG: cyclic nucleotide-binding domain-containing protein [Pseudomonadota bacterium]
MTWNHLTEADFEVLGALGTIRTCEKGDRLIDQATATTDVFWILDGYAEVDFKLLFHDEVLAQLGPGEHFGEMSFLLDEGSSASVVAMTAMRVLQVSAERLRELVQTDPELALRLYMTLAHALASRLKLQNAR